jgi:hypothetical protein
MAATKLAKRPVKLFLDAFNDIDALLGKATKTSRTRVSFPQVLQMAIQKDPVRKALAAFKQCTDRGEPLYGILVTLDGRHNSPPIGVITLFDVPRLWSVALGS